MNQQTEIRMYGVNLPVRKKLYVSLSYLYGVGRKNAIVVCNALGIDPERRAYSLTEEEINSIRKYIDANINVEGDLKAQIITNIKSLIAIGCYRGLRHPRGLPVRGQNTKRNARTRKGRKSKAIANKKKPSK